MQIEVGKRQKLKVIKKVDFGVYLAPGAEDGEKVLLPAKQVPAVCSVGDELEVFVYRDSKDRDPVPGDCFGEGEIGYHLRAGTHYLSREDWGHFMEYMRK